MIAQLHREHLLDYLQFDYRETVIPPNGWQHQTLPSFTVYISPMRELRTERGRCPDLIGQPAWGRAVKRDDDIFE